jgi:hypothetical protein
MRAKYAVTFEFMTNPPLTHRGTVVASKVHTCVRLATQEAVKALSPRGWSSMVVCLLERELSAKEIAEVEAPTVDEPADPGPNSDTD